MSGIVGMLRTDGAPADPALARALTRFLSFRGPDWRDIWCSGPVALGHALLRTAEESGHDRQPASLDGRFWITADARLDARAELGAELAQAGRKTARNAPDAELILHAYAAWGERCLERLCGDFSFGIWDAHQKELFCARDHLGIRPFYFTEQSEFFLFSNTLDCVRMHPGLPDELSDAAIADFLLFGLNRDPETTTFCAIRRLPPAHFLRVSREGLRIRRYWSMPVDGRIRHKHPHEYVEEFQAHLRKAVGDRLGGGRVGILLSGGLDSSSAAATARELSPERGESGKLRAYTVTHEKLLSDQDGRYAREVAEHLGIPIRCLPMDDLRPFARWDDPACRFPEPVDDPRAAGLFDQFGAIAAESRVAFHCEGPDNLLHFQMWPQVQDMARHGEWRQLCVDVPRFLQVRRFPWRGIRKRAAALAGRNGAAPATPGWLDPEFARRVDAESRWREGCGRLPSPAHPVKPRAHASMSLPAWTRMFELQDAGVTGHPVQVRHPFLDLRIINYLLAIPPFPWAFEKRILREAMAGRLPEGIRRRPKTPLPGSPVAALLRRDPVALDVDHWHEEMGRYVRREEFRSPTAADGPAALDSHLRPLCLNLWLQHSRTIRYKLLAEVRNG